MIQKNEKFLKEKNVKTLKETHAFKGYKVLIMLKFQLLLTLSYNLEILNL